MSIASQQKLCVVFSATE